MRDVRWKSRFHSDERQAPSYRVGRVFLAGDAAHVHSPAGAMGMNTGLQDAANLGWKLVAVLRDGADDALLDTYRTERHAVGRLVLRMSGTMVRAAILRHRSLRLLRTVAGTMVSHLRPVADRAALMISGIGIGIRYRAGRGAHPLTGRRAPDTELAEGRQYELLRGGRFVLIVPEGTAVPDLPDRIVLAHRTDDHQTIALVRPDGYYAWAGKAPGDTAALRDALTTWAGRLDLEESR
ncbi:hypothetical protein HNR61_006727 [Actinomadura namibiensis]|uniref:FAD-binding domain-containing protein n=2 Tax=Actinomadura TaxID=1988 RepID=A0A7W3LVI8_ACTNM|nr:hypothetical protein [Actinomadura namibiensis]